MSTILDTRTNAALDALPDAEPVDIDYKWLRKWGREDELIYVVTWADGTVEAFFTLPAKWNSIAYRCHQARFAAALRKTDASIDALRAPVDRVMVAAE